MKWVASAGTDGSRAASIPMPEQLHGSAPNFDKLPGVMDCLSKTGAGSHYKLVSKGG